MVVLDEADQQCDLVDVLIPYVFLFSISTSVVVLKRDTRYGKEEVQAVVFNRDDGGKDVAITTTKR